MLVLSRRKKQAILINGNVRLVIAQITGTSVRLAFEAPPHVSIDREEIAVRKGTKLAPARAGIAPGTSEGHVDSDTGMAIPAS